MEILLTGLSKVGKTSIRKVVFEDISPHSTVFLDSNNEVTSCSTSIETSKIKIYDIPQEVELSEVIPKLDEKANKILIFIIDLQEVTDYTYIHFENLIKAIDPIKEKTQIEAFLHKADGHFFAQPGSNRLKADIASKLKDIVTSMENNQDIVITTTSIYDHTMFEAFSKMYQKAIVKNNSLSNIIDNVSEMTRFERCFLFDIERKVYLASDNDMSDINCFEICSDMIDVIKDTEGIYRDPKDKSDADKTSVIKITNNAIEDKPLLILYLKQVSKNLAFIGVMLDINYEREYLIDYNIKLLADAVKEILAI